MSSTSPRRRGLGRGLDALIVNTDPTHSAAPEGAGENEAISADEPTVRSLALERIRPNPRQPRTSIDEGSLAELAASIRAHGIIQPLVVTIDPDNAGMYWLVAGERRWRAAQLAGLLTAPVMVRETTPQQLLELALIENIQRADLNPLEEASAYVALMEEFGLTQAEVAERVGKSRPAITNTVRLLKLPTSAQQALVDGRINAGHARALLSLPDAQQMEAALALIVQRDLSVRQAEALIKGLQSKPAQQPPEQSVDPLLRAHLARIEDHFRNALGTRVALNRNQDGSGRLIVHFYSDADLEALYQLIAGDEEIE